MKQSGFTLIELMVSVAVIAVLAAIALPLYSGYIETSREGVLVHNISTIEIFQEDFRLRTGGYLTEAADAATITAAINWDPRDDGDVDYSIAPGVGDTYQVTAVDASGVTVCRQLPDDTAC